MPADLLEVCILCKILDWHVFSLAYPEVYSECFQTCNMNRFVEKVNGF